LAKAGELFNELTSQMINPEKEFKFGHSKYKPPPALEKQKKSAEEKDKEKPIIRKALE